MRLDLLGGAQPGDFAPAFEQFELLQREGTRLHFGTRRHLLSLLIVTDLGEGRAGGRAAESGRSKMASSIAARDSRILSGCRHVCVVRVRCADHLYDSIPVVVEVGAD